MNSTHGSQQREAVIGDTGSGAVVDVRDVGRVFVPGGEAFVALAGVSMQIRAGELVALVGPSGCGKSTLLRIMAGLSRPTSGEVRIGGERLTGPRRDVGLMFQRSTLFPWRTALDNVLLPVDVQRKRTKVDRQKAEELLALVGLGDFQRSYPRELSGGMQQRVALCRVLMGEPAVMLLDEPFGALDEFTREALNAEMADILVRSKASGILVTHNIGEAVYMADRVLTMSTNPGVISGEIRVPEPRPRPIAYTSAAEFHDLVDKTRHLLGLE